jgi:hypothetical protein
MVGAIGDKYAPRTLRIYGAALLWSTAFAHITNTLRTS